MSGKIRFISDPHKSHEAMAKLRGFPDSYHHDENLIYQWNNVVDKRDTTWILGDITMHKNNYEWLDRLNGYKRIVLGNHDEGKQEYIKSLLKHVNSVHGIVRFKDKKYGNIFLTHCPIHPVELNYRVKYNIHGHVHENTIMIQCDNPQLPKRIDKRYINVSAEVINYIPQTLEELIKSNDNRITK